MIRSRLLIAVTILAPFLWCFGSVLLQDRSFGFRDAANYYYPLFEWECHEWAAGRVPLWNPLDNGGTPALADTTSSVLYPGKLIFALPASFRLRYHIYITAHVLLAAGMAYRLGRHWACSREASTLAALSYAFGGTVLFQYCNVVFLVGAAWLPFGVLATDRMLRDRSVGWALTLGAVLALMVLGGDPQAAYHTGMLSALYAYLLRRESRSGSRNSSLPWRRTRPVLLATAATAGVCLALVQILPATEWTRQSTRDSPDAPRNVYEATASLVSGDPGGSHDIAKGLVGIPETGTHLRHVYEFSVGPWHLVEFVWPNCFGRIFPKNERWSTAFPDEGRTWTPSLYVGLLPFVLALLSWRLWRCDIRIQFLSLLTLLALIGSFGWYGIGWFVYEIRAGVFGQSPDTLTIGEPVGGLYWLFVTLLPAYVYFRYPAKLLVVASLGISMLAARGWDGFVATKSHRVAVVLVVIAAFSLFAAAGFGLCQAQWSSWLADAPEDSIFGPLDIQAATGGVLTSFLHAAVLGLACWFLLRASNESGPPRSRFFELDGRMRRAILLGITAIELCVANGWMTRSIPGGVWSERQSLADAILADADVSVPPRLFRDPANTLVPSEWSEVGDQDRLSEVVAWERATLLPKHHLGSNIAVIGSHTTLTSADWQSFLRVARQWDREHVSDRNGALLDSMSVRFVAADEHIRGERVRELRIPLEERVRLYRDGRAFPRAWLVHNIQVLAPLADRSRSKIDQRTREVFFDNDQLRDLRSVAILESDSAPDDALQPPRNQHETDRRQDAAVTTGDFETRSSNSPGLQTGERSSGYDIGVLKQEVGQRQVSADELCKIRYYSAQRVEIEVHLTAPGCLVLNDTYYPGWRAVRVTDGVPMELEIYRANRIMRAVLLPAGQHRVVYTYHPQRVVIGAWMSGCAWLLLLAYGVRGAWGSNTRAKRRTSIVNS